MNVKVLLESLNERGETTSNILTGLFKEYAACSVKVFVMFISLKREGYNEGVDILLDIRMHLVMKKHKLLKTTPPLTS